MGEKRCVTRVAGVPAVVIEYDDLPGARFLAMPASEEELRSLPPCEEEGGEDAQPG